MERRKINAREAVADIRSGMNDTGLMNKYGLSSDGLQRLFNKLVNTGFIDLGEIRSRLSGFLETAVIPESDISGKSSGENDQALERKSARTVNMQEAARDIMLGMDDPALAEKYRLPPKALTSLFDELESLGLLPQKDTDRIPAVMEDQSVDLREVQRDLGEALKYLGFNSAASSAFAIKPNSDQSKVNSHVKDTAKKEIPVSGQKGDETFQRESRDVGPLEHSWYDKPMLLILLLLGIFPLGLYGLYRTRRMSAPTKTFIILGWLAVAVVWVLVFFGEI